MPFVRPPAVAGRFYPSDPAALRRAVRACLEAPPAPPDLDPKALVLPHAGLRYSGPVAGTGYRLLARRAGALRRVVLLGPAHRAPVLGLAATSADAFDTPLGPVRVDRAAVEALLDHPAVEVDDLAHGPEHSLEVHLPFLRTALGDASIVPLLAGRASAAEVAEVLDRFFDDEGTVTVVSSDLSHYHDARVARTLDRRTADAIEALDAEALGPEDACGYAGVRGLLLLARRRRLSAVTLDLRNSGDTAGPADEVVGYGAFAFVPAGAPAPAAAR